MIGMNMIKMMTKLFAFMLLIGMGLFGNAYAADEDLFSNKIENIDFSALSGGRVSIRVQLKEPLANPPAGFTLNNPARIALDFPQTGNGMSKSNIPSEQGALKSVSLAQAKDRTRMVLNLSRNVGYNAVLNGNDVIITLQGNDAAAGAPATETRFAESKASSDQTHAISGVDFARGKNGEGRIMVDLSDSNTGINIKQKGKLLIVDFVNTDVPAELQRRLNVINFNTPVLYVDTMKQGKNGRMVIEPKGNWEQSAYQADNKFIIDVRQVIEDPNKLVKGNKPGYAGEKLSLNFQNIEVRSVLQVIADFTGLNIIASDTVTGNITLRLKDVPWDQALDIIMKNKGLDMRKTGNVISIAPAEEIAAKEKAQLESISAIEDLEPLRTEVFTLRYQKAETFKNILTGSNSGGGSGGSANQNKSILSKRGSAVWDPRTNTLFIQDTAKKLEEIQAIINQTDVAVKQVMIESRLVLADDKFGKQLGARFGVAKINSSNTYDVGSTLSGSNNPGSTINAGGLNSNLPATASGAASLAFSLFRLPAGLLLNLELSALETDKRGKIVSSPRVTTANQQKARIASGTEIPYLEASSSGAATVSFKEAVLSLEVTPQITPDDKIIMDLDIKKDKVGTIFRVGLAEVPSIDTQNIQTQVLVSNGETAVLGGIYEQIERNDVEKIPFFGDIPIVGNAFKRKTKQDDRTELLIFITPKIMDESLGLR
jgi:type IV pilus assembly protein PilQ